ncbi:hypothetical protein ACP70R_025623 [Stipagrostis hirtigluma subsp. patula]
MLESMASRTSNGTPCRAQQFSALLSSVVLEWVLMLLLLLEGLLSYLVTTFACLCKLPTPCPMCTRLDHVLGKAPPGFYRDLMCKSHKAEASSWAFCHIHQKLVDVHSMCEACLLSFATDKKSNLETYQSLVGKLGVGINNVDCRHSLSFRRGGTEASVSKEDTLCSCCSRSLKVKSYPFVVLQNKASGAEFEGISRDVSKYQCMDDISYVAYSELKTSDCESEPQQDGADPKCLPHDATDNSMEGFTFGRPQTKITDGNPSNFIVQNILEQSESIQVQNCGSSKRTSEDSGELGHIHANEKANIHSTDTPREGGQQITEDSDTRDKLEDDVWHNALSSTEELLEVANKSAQQTDDVSKMEAEFTHRATRKDSFKVNEDLKVLLSQLSTTSQSPETDSPTIQDQSEQAILHNITRAISLERNYSGISESMVNEAEGECTVDQLKQQIELDRKSISRLWKELEEERNASTVAANQTMAMITRLQEEKAAMQMEAFQYQRMMEEQSEFDRENLQKMAEMVQELRAEIQSYKVKLRDQLLVDEIRDHMRLPYLKEHEPSTSTTAKSLSGFEDEKTYISKCLRKLRKKLHQFSNNSIPSTEPSDDTNSMDAYGDANQYSEKDNLVLDDHVRRNGNSSKDLTRGNYDPKGQYHAMMSENDLASFEEEICEVSGRLMALEADQSFLEHSVNSLRNGKAGEELIRDIACSLRELRKMGTWKEYD